MEWQDISTAPRDGTVVLLCGGEAGDDFSNRELLDPKIVTIVSRPVTAVWVPKHLPYHRGYWAYAYWDSEWRSLYENPTHWMPLDAIPPPKA